MIADKPRFGTAFYGTVVLIDYLTALDGNLYVQFEGNVEILEGGEALGFKIRTDGGANYGVRVAGPTADSAAYVFPGCKVKAVIAHKPDAAAVRTVRLRIP